MKLLIYVIVPLLLLSCSDYLKDFKATRLIKTEDKVVKPPKGFPSF